MELPDAYMSLEALKHAAIPMTPMDIEPINAPWIWKIPKRFCQHLQRRGRHSGAQRLRRPGYQHDPCHQYARKPRSPFFGICLGMQCAVIEYAGMCAGMAKANSTEFDEATRNPCDLSDALNR